MDNNSGGNIWSHLLTAIISMVVGAASVQLGIPLPVTVNTQQQQSNVQGNN